MATAINWSFQCIFFLKLLKQNKNNYINNYEKHSRKTPITFTPNYFTFYLTCSGVIL